MELPATIEVAAAATRLPIDDFLRWAYRFWRVQHEQQAGWRSPLWWFAWVVRGHPTYTDLLDRPAHAAEDVEQHLLDWTILLSEEGDDPPFGRSPDVDGWAEWFGFDGPDARAEFIDVWAKARHLPGRSPLDAAYDAACRKRVTLPAELMATRPIDATGQVCDDYGFFVSLAAHLQAAHGGRAVMLPCRELAALLGVSEMTVSRYRRFAVADGLMVQVRAHRYTSTGKGRATEFRVNLERLAIRRE